MAALDLVQPKISFHLAILKEAGLIRDRKESKWTHYRLNEEDMFRRMLLYSAIERMSGAHVSEDMARLEKFLAQKAGAKASLKITKKARC